MSLYIDFSNITECIGVIKDGEPAIPTGTTVSPMPHSVREREQEAYDRFFRDYDIRFLFDGDCPDIDFYAVPRVDVAAVTGEGGLIASVIQPFDLNASMPLIYIAPDRKCFLITEDSTSFLSIAPIWRDRLQPYDGVQLFPSREAAEAHHKILNLSDFCASPA